MGKTPPSGSLVMNVVTNPDPSNAYSVGNLFLQTPPYYLEWNVFSFPYGYRPESAQRQVALESTPTQTTPGDANRYTSITSIIVESVPTYVLVQFVSASKNQYFLQTPGNYITIEVWYPDVKTWSNPITKTWDATRTSGKELVTCAGVSRGFLSWKWDYTGPYSCLLLSVNGPGVRVGAYEMR